MPNDEVAELNRYDGVVGALADQIRALVPQQAIAAPTATHCAP